MSKALMSGIVAAIVGVLATATLLQAEDWPNWRGPQHDGISREKLARSSWVEAPKVLWEQSLGSAFSAFACVKDRVYTCGTKQKRQVLFCLEAQTGKIVWQVPFEAEYKDRQGGDGTRSTPTVDDGRVYIIGGSGLLLCVDANDGKELWKHQLSSKPNWGYSGSVLIQGDLAVVPAGGKDGSLLALNKKTAAPVWKCGDEAAGYSSPFPFTFKNKAYIFCFTAKSALIVDAAAGKVACRIPWETDWDVNASEPNYVEGRLFLTTGYNTGCALFDLEPAGEGLTARQVWKNQVLLAKFTSCVLKDGKLYGGDQKGLRCVDLATGKEEWKEDKFDNASVLLVGDYLIVQTEGGEVILAKADPAGFKSLGSIAPMKGRSWTLPTLSHGRLFLRNFTKAVCVDLRQ